MPSTWSNCSMMVDKLPYADMPNTEVILVHSVRYIKILIRYTALKSQYPNLSRVWIIQSELLFHSQVPSSRMNCFGIWTKIFLEKLCNNCSCCFIRQSKRQRDSQATILDRRTVIPILVEARITHAYEWR